MRCARIVHSEGSGKVTTGLWIEPSFSRELRSRGQRFGGLSFFGRLGSLPRGAFRDFALGGAVRGVRGRLGFAPGRTPEFASKNPLTKVIAFISESTGPFPKIGLIRGRVYPSINTGQYQSFSWG